MTSVDSFELSATNILPYTNISFYSWVASSGSDLTVQISDPDNVTYDGFYYGMHTNGKAQETFSLLICHIKRPVQQYLAGYAEPFTVVK